MKRIITLLLILVAVQSGYSTNWMTSFEDAQKLALVHNKLIVVDFWATWCGPCKKMDVDAWNTEEVSKLMDGFIPLKIDIDSETAFARRYGVNSIPNIFVIDPNGEIVASDVGYKSKVDLIKYLKKYMLNTSFLNREMVSYFQNENFASTFRLAKKYMDYSLLVDNEVKNEFYTLADIYLNKSSKLVTNQPKFEEKLALLEMTIDVYRGNHKRVSRKLSKTKEEDIDAINKCDFYFLNYCISRNDEDEDQALVWLDKLKQTNNFEMYNSKINLVFNQS